MANDISQIILDELREHRRESADRHELMDVRLRTVENWQHEIKGKATMFGVICTACGGIIAWLTSLLHR